LTNRGASVYCTHWDMIRLRQSSFVHWAVLSAMAALMPAGALRADLASSSPFLPAGVTGAAAGAGPAEPVELRGIMSLPEGMAYCIYDAAKKTSAWVGLNETGNEFVVKSADPANDSVTVTVQGRDIRLALKASKVVSAGAGNAGSPVPPGPGGGPGLTNAVSINPTPGDEQRRLDAVAAEVRRRRQEREKATQGAANAAAGQPAPPAPSAPNR
jgi:hypothetical protein